MKGRVLVVDDDQALAEMLGIVLRKEGLDVAHVADGARAIDAFHETRPDLVLLDIDMPEQDGFALLEQLPPEQVVAVVTGLVLLAATLAPVVLLGAGTT